GRIKTGQSSIPQQLVSRVDFRGGGLQHDIETVPDYVGLASKILFDFSQELRLDELVEALGRIPEVRRFLMIGSGGAEPTQWNLRVSLLAQIIGLYYRETSPQPQDAFRFHEEAFSKVYDSFEEYLYGTEDAYRLIAPLLNFEMVGDRLTLGSVTIRRLDRDEI